MATRPSSRKPEREELIAYLHGIDAQGDLAHILVHKRGDTIRFSGRLGNHTFLAKNSDMTNWIEEAERVWELEATIGVPRGSVAAPEILERVAELNNAAAKKKKALGLEAPGEPQSEFTAA